MIPDEDIRKKADANGDGRGIWISIDGQIIKLLTRYEAFRFSGFLDEAIMKSCKDSGEQIDKGFAK